MELNWPSLTMRATRRHLRSRTGTMACICSHTTRRNTTPSTIERHAKAEKPMRPSLRIPRVAICAFRVTARASLLPRPHPAPTRRAWIGGTSFAPLTRYWGAPRIVSLWLHGMLCHHYSPPCQARTLLENVRRPSTATPTFNHCSSPRMPGWVYGFWSFIGQAAQPGAAPVRQRVRVRGGGDVGLRPWIHHLDCPRHFGVALGLEVGLGPAHIFLPRH